MDCMEAIQTRRSIRKFKREAVSEDDLRCILEAGRFAPSAGNLQPCYFIVVKDEAVRMDLQKAAFGQETLSTPPVVIVVCVDPDRSSHYGEAGRTKWCLMDGANATENMLLAAHALGYGACWMGGFQESTVKQVLGLPEGFRVVSIIPVGKADEAPPSPPKRDLDEVVRWGKW